MICDYCGKEIQRQYKEYLHRHDDELGDCCKKCEYVKAQVTMKNKYGVDKASEIPGYFDKIKASNLKKFGVEWAIQNQEVLNKQKATVQNKYGVEHILQNPIYSAKVAQTKSLNNTSPTTKPQKMIGKILEELYGKCILEKPCGACNLDCAISINDINIDVEYDGHFYHQDKQRDRRRDNFVKSQGYKVLRIKGAKKDPIPTKEQLQEAINTLVTTQRKYIEIVM